MTLAPTGTQYLLHHGDQEAVVTELGTTLRSYRVAGRELLDPFEEDQSPFGGQGQQLMPWPNRLRDGRWVSQGEVHQLPISEPERMCAIHGLVRWVPWGLVERTDEALTLRHLLHPQPGWPGLVEILVTHELTDDGLVVRVEATNRGQVEVPFGYGAHPYLAAPDGVLSETTALVPFGSVLAVDQRLLPVDLVPVEGSMVDMRQPRSLAGVGLDTAFTDPDRTEGRWTVRLSGREHATEMWGDEALDWLQLYTPGDGRSIAVEPMSCGPDAFNPGPTHAGLRLLGPGEVFTASWGLRGTAV